MTKFLRGAAEGISGFMFVCGVAVFVHDILVLLQLAAPAGDGPFGLVIGPIFVIIGAVWFVWLRRTGDLVHRSPMSK